MSASYLFCIAYFHSSHAYASIKEVGSNSTNNFNSKSNETSMTSPELSTYPPSSYMVELLVLVLPTSSIWTLSIAFVAHLGTFCDGPS